MAAKALHWYEIVKPYLASSGDDDETVKEEKRVRDSGRYVHFATNDPWPSALLRHSHMTAAVSAGLDRKSTRLNSSHVRISYAVFCLKKKKKTSKDIQSNISSIIQE